MTDLTAKLELKTPGELLSELVRYKSALEKVRSYNVDIAAGRINYRPHDHIQVIDEALSPSQHEIALTSRKGI